jgi:hypothetical protein
MVEMRLDSREWDPFASLITSHAIACEAAKLGPIPTNLNLPRTHFCSIKKAKNGNTIVRKYLYAADLIAFYS